MMSCRRLRIIVKNSSTQFEFNPFQELCKITHVQTFKSLQIERTASKVAGKQTQKCLQPSRIEAYLRYGTSLKFAPPNRNAQN